MRKKLTGLVGVAWILLCSVALAGAPDGHDYQALVELNEQLLEFREPTKVHGFPDFSAEAMASQQEGLRMFFDRFEAIDPSKWTVAQQVDYLLVRAQLNQLDFSHRVLRPWARDPGVYVGAVQQVAFQELPASADELSEFTSRLEMVPAFLDQAKTNLTEGAGMIPIALIRWEMTGLDDEVREFWSGSQE